MGHYGDGWNEWYLDASFKRQREEREAKGDFGAESALETAIEYVERADSLFDLHQAEGYYARAGALAVYEALFEGVVINGWEEASYPEKMEVMDIPLSRIEKLPDKYQIIANLADNGWLREIRQTGSQLIPSDREAKFAQARIDALRAELEAEEAELGRLQPQLSLQLKD